MVAQRTGSLRISKQGLDFIKGFESFVGYVYDDKRSPVKGKYPEWKGEEPIGTLTIGYGHTNSAKHPLKITQGLRITEKEAQEILDVDLDECEGYVNKTVKNPLTQGQFDALVSFTFNCGPGNLKNLTERINRGDYNSARAAFDFYNKSKGEYMRGLQRRRDGEQALWDDIDVAPPTEIVEHSEEVDGAGKIALPDLAKTSAIVAALIRARTYLHTAWITLAGLFTLENIGVANGAVSDVRTLVDTLAFPAAFIGIICGILLIRYLVRRIHEGVEDGRIIPDGK
jgi:lysozyme